MEPSNPAKGRGGTASALVLGASLVASALVWSATFYQVKAFDNALVTTGSVRKRIASDAVKWTGSFTRTAPTAGLPDANARMSKDLAAVMRFLADRGIDEASVTVSPVTVEPVWRGNAGPEEFTIRQTIKIQSADIAGTTRIAKESSALIDQGVLFSTVSLEYTYTKLSELRVEMLTGALEDARARAGAIAQASGTRLGRLKSASA